MQNQVVNWEDRYFLYFEINPDEPLGIDVLLSNDLNKWLAVTKPPSPDEIKLTGGDESHRAQQIAAAQSSWLQATYATFGDVGMAYFQIDAYHPNSALNSEEGVKKVRDRAGKLYLALGTPTIWQATGAAGKELADARFVDAVKSVLAKCRNSSP